LQVLSVEPSVPITVVLCYASSSPPPPVFRFPRRASTVEVTVFPLVSDYDYDFSQFGHWDGDSASYYKEYNHYTPPGPSRQSSQPRRLPSPLTPLASPSAFVQEFVQGSSTSGTQYEYTLTDIHGELPSGLPSPISRPTTPHPATPLKYGEEAFSPIFDIRMQVAVQSAPLHEPTPELVYPDPPIPSSRPVSAPPRVPSPPPRTSTPLRVPTPDSPINYERVAEQSPRRLHHHQPPI
ncbi:hypothetical protein EDB89DRAFT_1914617, partial [Lactarius sanguifluus]